MSAKKISDYVEVIQKISPQKNFEVGKCASPIWQNKLDELPSAREAFVRGGEIKISRKTLFGKLDGETRLIGILLWGYPRGMRGGYLNGILENQGSILSALQEYGKSFHECFEKLYKIRGLGLSTITKILYFFEIKTDDGYYVPIIDRYVRESMSLFDEFESLCEDNDFEKLINDTAKSFASIEGVEFDDVEYFLFDLGRSWNKEKGKYMKNYIDDYKAKAFNKK